MKKTICLILALVTVLSFVTVSAGAVSAGDTFAPNMSAWGTQNNNNWYYMYKTSGGQYVNLTYRDGSASIDWQRNRYASDPNATGEMLFINKESFFTGEKGSKPVYGFKAPQGGRVELTVLTHGTADLRLELLKNSESLKVISFTTTGSENGFTRTTVTVDVKKNTWLYMEGSTVGTAREGWVKDFSVKYLSTNSDVENESQNVVYAPDLNKWGTQGNNGWYYMAKSIDNTYVKMDYFTASAKIDWQKSAFASDPDAVGEMYFIGQQKCFTGELGTRPAYAFLCPSGGEVELTVLTHGKSTMCMEIFKNKDSVKNITFSTSGNQGEYTKTTVKISVKKNTWLYMVVSATGADREAWVKDYSVKYLSTNNEVESGDTSLIGEVFSPNMKVLKQNNNGWYCMYYDGLLQRYEELPLYGADAAIEWQRNAFAFDPNMMFEMLFMTNDHYFIGENGSCPVYAFQCPVGGKVRLKVRTHGREDMQMTVFYNDQQKDQFSYNTTGPLAGFTEHAVTMDVKEGGWIYMVCGSTGENRDGWLSFYGVEYLSVNGQVEDYKAPQIYTPDMNAWGTQNNNNWNFAYLDKGDNLFRKLAYVRADGYFQGTAEGGYEYLMIKPLEMHPAVKGSPAKVFSCPSGGKVLLSFQAWMQNSKMSLTGTGVAVYKNGVKIWPENEEFYKLDSTIFLNRLEIDVAKGDDLAIVIDALEKNVNYDATNVRVAASYLSYNDAVRTEWPEYPQEQRPDIGTPDDPGTPDNPADPTDPTPSDPDGSADSKPTDKPSDPADPGQNGSTWLLPVIIGAGVAAIAAVVVIIFLKKRKK